MQQIEINEKFEEVLNFINNTNENVFLTGKAGTGKTTLLKYIKSKTHKRMAIVAPTGVAAINAGGSTIHSFFQFHFGSFIPIINSKNEIDVHGSFKNNFNYRRQKLAILKNLELLVIDEVSMVRADMMDQIDVTLKNIRKNFQEPFGGLQVLLIGDMYQLPPVVKNDELESLKKIYDSFYFFNSKVIQSHFPIYIELNKIYRQKEQQFVDILNAVRSNTVNETILNELNNKFEAEIVKSEFEKCITLTTHNSKADKINEETLKSLKTKEYVFKAKIKGSFNENSYPVDEQLKLKVGTKVMFLKNNTEKNYYNGKIGYIKSINDDFVIVKCTEDFNEIKVENEVWNNIAFELNEQTKTIEEKVLGSFTQLPLRLAWAVTIHKSQGLSFDKVIIDAAEAFTAGQVYVALSRCRSLQGLKLSSKIRKEVLFNDEKIIDFSKNKLDDNNIIDLYVKSEKKYFKYLILQLYDFTSIKNSFSELKSIIYFHKKQLNTEHENWLINFNENLIKEINVAVKFSLQLQNLILQYNQIDNETITERLTKSAHYFDVSLTNILKQLKENEIYTESTETAEEINELLNELFELLFEKRIYINTLFSGFNHSKLIKAKLNIKFPEEKINIYVAKKKVKINDKIKNNSLYEKLTDLRNKLCNELNLPIYRVANAKTLKELSERMPDNETELLEISGFGKAKINRFGKAILEIIINYKKENNITSEFIFNETDFNKKNKKEKITELKPKGATYETTLNLINSGMKLEEISLVRKLNISTIEAHVAKLIKEGLLDVHQFIKAERLLIIENLINTNPNLKTLNALKEKLPYDFTFNEIKMALSALQGN